MEDNSSIDNTNPSNPVFDNQISEYRRIQQEKYKQHELSQIKVEEPVIKPLRPQSINKPSFVNETIKSVSKSMAKPLDFVRPPIPRTEPQTLISSPLEAILNTPFGLTEQPSQPITQPIAQPISQPISQPIAQPTNNDIETEITAILGNIESYTHMIDSYRRRLKTDKPEIYVTLRTEIADYEQKVLDLRKRLRILLAQ